MNVKRCGAMLCGTTLGHAKVVLGPVCPSIHATGRFSLRVILTAPMVILNPNQRSLPVPRLAARSSGVGVVAITGANVAHGLEHGPIGALVSTWLALALVGSYELLMAVIRAGHEQADALSLSIAEAFPWRTQDVADA
jgi:hypothetical protein